LLLVNAASVGGHESIKMRVSATRREQLLDGIAEVARVTREGLDFEVWDHDFEDAGTRSPTSHSFPKRRRRACFAKSA